MTWTLDIIIVLIIGLTIFFAAKNGFIKTAISAVSFIIAIAITAAFASPFAEIIKETSVAQSIESATEEQITDIILDGSYEIDALLNGDSNEFNAFVAIAGIDRAELDSWFSETVVDTETAESALAKRIAAPIIDTVAMLVAILVLYIGAQIVLAIIAFILDKVANLPVLHSCNKLLGIVLGVVLAFIRVCLFCFVVKILIENSAFLGNDIIESLQPEKTLLYKIFSNIDIFSFFL